MTFKNGIFTVLWLMVIITGIWLGFWQLHRLEWKRDWLAQIDAAYRDGPTPESVNAGLDLPFSNGPEEPPGVSRTFFIRWDLHADFKSDKMFHIRPRVREGIFGGYLYQMADLPNAQTIWINRGFIPDGTIVKPLRGRHHVVIDIGAANITPATVIEQNPILSQADLKDLCAPGNCNAPGYLGTIETIDIKSAWPLPVGERPNPPNDHLYYACFWFTMSGVAFLFGLIAAWNIYKKRSL